jgi:hypothetical protein
VARYCGESFQELADEAFKDLLKKPVGLKAAQASARRPESTPAPSVRP